ncbi:MAG: hypothetical protein ABSB09_09575 [Acidimicrobiales bacterium]|jgi:hypothetical protein
MTTATLTEPAGPAGGPSSENPVRDHRGSWVPNGAMIATRFMELRKRRGLMIALILVNIGIPVVFLTIRLLAHAFAPNSYGPAGGYDIFSVMVAGVLFIFGFIVAATVGCTAGSVDLTEGMFRHLVVTGRSRLALYLARIPAGLAIIVPMVAAGFTIVCLVCVFAAPTQLNYYGVIVPPGLSHAALDSWAADHADEVICDFQTNIGPNSPSGPTIVYVVTNVCGNGPGGQGGNRKGPAPSPQAQPTPTNAQIEQAARFVADQDYSDYAKQFLSPSISLMIRSGLWIELYAAIGFLVGLGLSSLMGQRTVPVILMIVLEIVLTPLLSHPNIPHVINLQRGLIGVATSHLEPAGLPSVFGGMGGGGGGGGGLVPESVTAAVCVIVGWVVVWTALGAWRMMTRDA